MRAVLVKYNYDTDATTVRVDSEFNQLPLIHQLDCLRDALHDLGIIYDKKLDDLHNNATNNPDKED